MSTAINSASGRRTAVAIAGIAVGGIAYEVQQLGIAGRTFDWFDAIVVVLACIPAFLLADKFAKENKLGSIPGATP